MTPPISTERVLSTLNEDGSRFWIRPKLARGRFLRRRRIVGYALIALFVALPFVKINGRPALLLDLVTRELSVCGAVFRPSDGFLVMLLGLTVVLTVFLITALFGRVWCGWGCPQTVYLEHVFRPIERWLEGSPAQQKARDERGGLQGARILKWGIYAVICFVLANVFLAYFVGAARLEEWVLRSPNDHIGGFLLVVGVSALMLFDFAYFREQMCIVACPYGRLQTVLLDKQSLIVGYDAKRGEPRGKPKKKLPVVGERGDCVDCGACVSVCPTGIDIRNGLQMECIGCAQCIDACDSVMDKLKKPRALIGYTSRDMLAGGARKLLRVRTVVYPTLLVIVSALFVWGVGGHASTKVWVDRISGPTFVKLPSGAIASQLRLKLENEGTDAHHYTVAIDNLRDVSLRGVTTFDVKSLGSFEATLFVESSRSAFVHGKRSAVVRVTDERGHAETVTATLFGPEGALK
ncbi:MAG TPA: cytochrome c oxidase accessory protein CcoG [Kofleriaceae bacterium]|jgi:cytochrome c oxidase accessory protein FixG